MAKRRGFGSISPQTGSKDKLKMDDVVDIFNLPSEAKNTWVNMRFLPTDMLPIKTHWIKILAGKEKKEVKIPKLCVSFDPDAEATPKEGTHCPYCELTQGGEDATCQTGVAYYANAIIRDIQEDEPRKVVKPSSSEKKSGFIQKGSKAWTPVRVVRLPNGLAGKLDGLTERNIVKSKKNKKIDGKSFPIDHEKFGIDIAIKFDPKAAGAEKYQLDKGERNALTDEEQAYLVWDLSDDLYEKLGLESTDEAKKEFKRLDFVGGEEIDDADDEEDEDDDDEDNIGFASKKKKGKKGKKRRPVDDDEDEDEDDDDDDEDEPVRKKKKKPVKKSKKPLKKKRRPVDDDDDEDEDDEPVRKKKKKPVKKSSDSKKKPKRKSKF